MVSWHCGWERCFGSGENAGDVGVLSVKIGIRVGGGRCGARGAMGGRRKGIVSWWVSIQFSDI